MKYIIGNWKMNPERETEAVALASEIIKRSAFDKHAEVVVAPPFLFLPAVAEVLRGTDVKWGAQNVSAERKPVGAYTGEVSAAQLKDRGVAYVIVGHSERRALGETDEMVGGKLAAVVEAGMVPILCVGEPADVRAKGVEAAKEFVKTQLTKAFEGRGDGTSSLKGNVIVAYEPVWAISANPDARPAMPEDAVEMASFIKETLGSLRFVPDAPVLYGGSVTAENAAGFLGRDELDGVLVGGASLDAEMLSRIAEYASRT